MENISNLLKDETIKAIIKYLIPLILAALIAFGGKFIGFVFSEIFTARRILILLLIFLTSLYINPSLAGWATFLTFLVIIVFTLLSYFFGIKSGNNIIFAGFYDVSGANGYFCRTGASKILDAQFFRNFKDLVTQSNVQQIRPISILAVKPSALIHSWCDYERFEWLTARYVKKSLGVIWGTVNKDGHLQHIEVRLNESLYHGQNEAQETINNIIEDLNSTDLRSEEKANFISRTFASIWCNSFSNDITDSGSWRTALQITKDSQQIFERAVSQLEKQNKTETINFVKNLRKTVLPLFYVEEARNRLCGEQWEEATEHLIRTILLNPFFPFNTVNEFSEFYLAKYKAEITASSPLKDEIIDSDILELADKARFIIPPHLQLLINWLYGCGNKIKNLDKKIEKWFSTLSNAFPDNPFIFLYWADAVKIPFRLGLKPNLKPGPGGRLPIEVMDKAITKCEAAYSISPDFHIISTRIAGMSFVSAFYFPEKSKQHQLRMKKFKEFSQKASIHLDDIANTREESDIYDWSKYGLTNEEVENAIKAASEKSNKK